MGAAIGIAVPVLIKDAEYTALNAGFFAQTMVKLAGQIRTPTSASTALMNRQLRDRIAIPVIDAAAWALAALKSLEKAGESNGWMGAAAAVSSVAMGGLFFGKELKEAGNRHFRGHPAPSRQASARSCRRSPIRRSQRSGTVCSRTGRRHRTRRTFSRSTAWSSATRSQPKSACWPSRSWAWHTTWSICCRQSTERRDRHTRRCGWPTTASIGRRRWLSSS